MTACRNPRRCDESSYFEAKIAAVSPDSSDFPENRSVGSGTQKQPNGSGRWQIPLRITTCHKGDLFLNGDIQSRRRDCSLDCCEYPWPNLQNRITGVSSKFLR